MTGLDIDRDGFDLCVVGAGPVGMAVALACAESGMHVCLLESGGLNDEPTAARLSAAEIVDEQRHAPMASAVWRGLGGTARWWGGRAVPLDPVDFVPRYPHLRAEWPLPYAEIAAWFPAAAIFLGIGPPIFSAPAAGDDETGAVRSRRLERWCRENDICRLHAARLRDRNGPLVLLRTTVIGLELDAPQVPLRGVVVSSNGERRVLRARQFVLACGGLETTRLLLATQRHHRWLCGGDDGPLGRFYMGHISGKIASVELTRSSDVGCFDFFREPTGIWVRRRWTISEDIQIRDGIQNIAFWLDNPPFHDASHRSGILSLVFLALAIGPVGRRLLPEGIRLSHLGAQPRRYMSHIANILGAPLTTLWEALQVLRDRYVRKPRKPGFLVRNAGGRYALHYHAEQAPNRESRVSLSDNVDPLGLPRLRIDLRFADGDACSVLRAHDHLDAALRGSGLGRLDHWYPAAQRLDHVLAQASDGFHQIGTTRMSALPGEGVVDRECRVHGIPNLYIASSSVFPTSGQANPTFTAVALALRLAAFLGAKPPRGDTVDAASRMVFNIDNRAGLSP